MAVVAVLLCFALYAIGYVVYSRYLARHVFGLRRDAVTPAHALEDGVDYVPTHRFVLFGHHFASITGLSPMLGPAIAVIWGWLPAMLWVVLGALVVGCVHDFGALAVSARSRGMSIGVVAQGLMGPRAKSLLHAIIFFGISLAMGVFVYIVAQLFSGSYPQSVMPSSVILLLALAVGWLVRRRGFNLWRLTAIAFVVIPGSSESVARTTVPRRLRPRPPVISPGIERLRSRPLGSGCSRSRRQPLTERSTRIAERRRRPMRY